MRPRTEAALALGSLALLGILAGALERRGNRPEQLDPRASSYLAGPLGARGLADALGRLKLRVEHYRRGTRQLGALSDSAPTVMAVVDPLIPYGASETHQLLEWHESARGGDLLLAGEGSAGVMRCFGYQPDPRPDSTRVRETGLWPAVGAVLAASESVVVDSSRIADTGIWTCTVPPYRRVDTLLTSSTGRTLALRLVRSDVDREVLLLSDATLLRNRSLRETDAGPWALRLFLGKYERVIFDEAHQGFGAGGSLADATLEWSLHSPLGWAAWQLAIVGILMLLAGAIRFGPIRSVISRKRRSPLEHVRALATALAAARGHDVAIGAVVQGLRRRLQPAGQRGRSDWRDWVERLSHNVRSPRAVEAAGKLQSLTRPGQPPEGVLQAANAVEDVWEELRP